jgi:hypothetical protein
MPADADDLRAEDAETGDVTASLALASGGDTAPRTGIDSRSPDNHEPAAQTVSRTEAEQHSRHEPQPAIQTQADQEPGREPQAAAPVPPDQTQPATHPEPATPPVPPDQTQPATHPEPATPPKPGPATGAQPAAEPATEPEPAAEPERASEPRPPWWRRGWLYDLAAVGSYLTLAAWVTYRLWLRPAGGLAANKADQAFFEWNLAHGARVVTEHVDPFISGRMNVPDGVNMMANTSVLGISLPFAPITLAYGAHTTFTVFLTFAFVATAIAWYFVLSRYLLPGARVAAWLGAAFCAFAPGMIAQGNGHPNIVCQFLVPVLIWRTLELRKPGRWLRNGVWLGLVVIWQAFINLEILFMTVVGLGIFVLVMALARRELRQAWRPFLSGLAVAGGLAVAALWYPLHVQFHGPGAYRGLPVHVRRFGADLASYVAISRESLFGDASTSKGLSQNPAEANSFFGWPLIILLIGLIAWLRRSAVVVGLALVAVTFAVFSFGPELQLHGHPTGIPSVWKLFIDTPVLSSAVPTRWALAVIPVVGMLLAVAAARAGALARRLGAWRGHLVRAATVAVVAVALVPIAPTALRAGPLPAAPAFITAGTWRPYTAGGRSLVFIPPASSGNSDPLRWSAQYLDAIPFTHGYFLGPNGKDGTAMFTAVVRPTTSFIALARRSRVSPPISDRLREQSREDLRFWRAGAIVMVPQPDRIVTSRYRAAMTRLLGFPPSEVDGVELWDVRSLS